MTYIPTGRELIDPFRLLEISGIRNGMVIADFGCGTLGHYVFPAASLAGKEGKVYAIDILKSVLGGIESKMKMEGMANIVTVWGDLETRGGVRIADESVDIGLLINNLFLSKQKDALVNECVRMVKGGGKLIVVDWKPSGISFGPEPATRVSAEETKKLAATAGLILEKEFSPGKYHYGLVYRKPSV